MTRGKMKAWKWTRPFTRVVKHKDCGCLGAPSSLGWRKCKASGFLYWCGSTRRKVRLTPARRAKK